MNLLPRTVYLPADKLSQLDARAADLGVTPGMLLRLIVLGKQPPLDK